MEPQEYQQAKYPSNPFAAMIKQLSVVLKANPISVLTLGLLMILIIAGTAFLGGFIAGLSDNNPFVLLVLTVGGIIFYLLVVLRFAAASLYLHVASREGRTLTARAAVSEVAKKNYNKFILTVILTTLITFAGLIALVLPGIFLGVRFALAPIAVMNEGLGIGAALKRSWRLTSGHWFEVLAACIASIIVVPNGLLSFVGGQSGLAGRYFDLTDLEKSGTAKPKMHWMNVFLPVLVLVAGGLYAWIVISAANNIKNSPAVNCLDSNSFISLTSPSCNTDSPFKSFDSGNGSTDFNFDTSPTQ